MTAELLKELNIIALVPADENYTLYLFERIEKYILPIPFDQKSAMLLLGDDLKQNKYYPNFYGTVMRLICGMGACLSNIIIYRYVDTHLYTYLTIDFCGKRLEFNVHITDALNLARRFNAPVLIRKEVLECCGIKVNKKILRDALSNKDYS